jgi:hypothetical protein
MVFSLRSAHCVRKKWMYFMRLRRRFAFVYKCCTSARTLPSPNAKRRSRIKKQSLYREREFAERSENTVGVAARPSVSESTVGAAC